MKYWYVNKFKREIIKGDVPPFVKKEDINVNRKTGTIHFIKKETIREETCFGTIWYKDDEEIKGYLKKKDAQEELNSILKGEIKIYREKIKELQGKIK